MARPLRLTYEGAVYHVTIRGNDQQTVFRTKRDRQRFVTTLGESVRLYDVRLYLFCLMTNHVHLVLETPQGNLSRFMQRLQTAYVMYFNRRHDRSGHLFQGRFGASMVDEDEYILKLSRYVHLNPVYVSAQDKKTNRERVQYLRQYTWSSYPSYIGQTPRLPFVDYKPLLSLVSRSKKQQSSEYRRFVEGGIRNIDAAFIEARQHSRLFIGSAEGEERAKETYAEMLQAYDQKEDIAFRQERVPCSVEEVLTATEELLGVSREGLLRRSRDGVTRPVTAYALCRYAGCTQRAAGEVMGGCTGVAVSIQIKKLHEQLKSDKATQELLSRLERKLT